MPNRSLVTANSTKTSLALVPLSHLFICFTGPPLGLFQTAPFRLCYRAALLFVPLIIPFVCFTKPLFSLSTESPHFYKEHLLFVSQPPFCLFLSQTYLFVCCTDLFRCCTDQRFYLHLRETFHCQKASHAFIASHSEASQAFIAVSLSLRRWLESHIHYLWFDILNWNLHSRKKVG